MDIENIIDDTHLSEPEEEQYFSTADLIMKLSDELSEEIVLENITEQLSGRLDTTSSRINYVALFREKYESIDTTSDIYNIEYMQESLAKVTELVLTGLNKKYAVNLGEDLDYRLPTAYLSDVETMYEFLFIRHFENLVTYFINKIRANKVLFIERYSKLIAEEPHSKDLFVVQAKRRFKNVDDVTILHFMDDIISDVVAMSESGYDIFRYIISCDFYEEYNNRMSAIMDNYGNGFIVENDDLCAHRYLSPVKDTVIHSELKNRLRLLYLEDCEILDEVQ